MPEELAARVAVAATPAYALLGIVEIADRDEPRPDRGRPACTSRSASGSACPRCVQRILALPRDDRWQTMARAALRDDLYAVHAQLTAQVLATTSADEGVAEKADPEELRARRCAGSPSGRPTTGEVATRAVETLGAICGSEDTDLARVSVALRVVRGTAGLTRFCRVGTTGEVLESI